jgi:V-type H+-transporting ATPase subunit C
VVNPAKLIRDSEYIESHLIAVPNLAKKDFKRSYETLVDMVVPRSAEELSHDDEFTLFAVVTFKKTSAEFLQKCREQKWTPRQYTYVGGGVEAERKELDRIEKETNKMWGEAMRMAVTGWSQSVQIWMHLLALRVFVEAVLRYGLPLDYVSAIVKVCTLAWDMFLRPQANKAADDFESFQEDQTRSRRQIRIPWW